MPTLEPGTRFANYSILRLLGEGAAEVYEVIAPNGARRALKVARPATAEAPQRQDRAAQEADAIATVEHVHLARIYAAGIEDGRVWMELELVDGLDLKRLCRVEGGKLAVDRAVRIVRQCAEGVAAAHAVFVLHRDLRPENLLVTRDDLAKVGDFGRAKGRAPGVESAGLPDAVAVLYRAPEAMRPGGGEAKSDVYSLAIVLYEVIAGENPFGQGSESMVEVVKRHLGWHPPPLASLSTAERPIPNDLSVLVQRALSKVAAERPTMREFADELGVVLSRLDAPRRALARNLALPNRPFVLAKTQPLAEVPSPSGRGGTIPMAAVPAPAAGREAAPPPPPSGPVRTQRSPTFFEPAPPAAPPPPPVRAAVATIAPEAPGERRSTGTPVERPAPARTSLAGPGRRRTVLALAAGALALALVGVGGWLLGRGGGQAVSMTPAPAAASVASAQGASGSGAATAAAPSADASAARPKTTAAPAKPRAPQPQRQRLPFP